MGKWLAGSFELEGSGKEAGGQYGNAGESHTFTKSGTLQEPQPVLRQTIVLIHVVCKISKDFSKHTLAGVVAKIELHFGFSLIVIKLKILMQSDKQPKFWATPCFLI